MFQHKLIWTCARENRSCKLTQACVLNHKQLNYTLDIATSAGCILPPLIGAHRNPASHYLLFLLFPKKGHMKSSARTAGASANSQQTSILILTTAYLMGDAPEIHFWGHWGYFWIRRHGGRFKEGVGCRVQQEEINQVRILSNTM